MKHNTKVLIVAISFGVLAMLFSLVIQGCSVNSSKLDTNYVQSFAEDVRCAKGYAGKCWCFVASRRTGSSATTGIGMTLAPDELCQ